MKVIIDIFIMFGIAFMVIFGICLILTPGIRNYLEEEIEKDD